MWHDEKYLLINQDFAGKQRLMPFFNRQNNDDLILVIQAAGVSRGRNGFFASKAPKAMNAKTKAAKNLPRAKSSACRFRSMRRKNTPRTPHRWLRCVFSHAVEATSWLIRSTSAARNFPTAMLLHSPYWAYRKIIPCFYI